MTQQGRYELLDTVELNGEFYRLVRNTDQSNGDMSHVPYQVNYLDEPPYGDGAPPIVSEAMYTFHLGGLKSRQGIPGTTEYGQNTDGRWAFRLLPSAKINDLTLTSSAANPTSMFEALGYVWVICGQRVYRIHPSTNVVTLSKTFGGSTNGVMGVRWENDFGLVTTDDNTQSLWKVTAIGSPDTWTQTADVAAYRLAVGSNRLFKINKTGEVKNIITSLDPMVNANWADSVQVGETSTLPTALLAYERTVFAGKPEGLFGIGDNGFGMPVIKRMARETSNCAGMANFDPYVLVPHVRGLYRYLPGTVDTIGVERELLNDSPLVGRWKSFVADGEWIYGSMTVGSATYILVGRERRGGESGFSPIIWDSWLYFAGACQSMWLSALSTNPRLYFGNGNNVSYVELTTSPGAVEYATSGSRYLPKMKFDDWNTKDFPYIDIVGKNLDASNYWVLNYSIDGGAFSDLDRAGAQMRKQTNGRSRFVLPITATGREIQWRLDFVYDGSGTPPEVAYVELYASPQSRKMSGLQFNLQLEEGIRHGTGSDPRTSSEQLNDLIALSESASAVNTKGPWGEDVYAWFRKPLVKDLVLRGDKNPIYVVEVSVQIRETS